MRLMTLIPPKEGGLVAPRFQPFLQRMEASLRLVFNLFSKEWRPLFASCFSLFSQRMEASLRRMGPSHTGRHTHRCTPYRHPQGGIPTVVHTVLHTGRHTHRCTPCYTHPGEAYPPLYTLYMPPREATHPEVHRCYTHQGGYTP